MTQEEINKSLEPKEPSYNDYLRQLEQMPSFNYDAFRENWKVGEKPMMEALMSAYTKPEQKITPDQARRARNASAISDAFTGLAEIFAHSRGANVRNRAGKSSMRTTNDRLQEIQNKYEQDMIRYNTARGNAEMQDFQSQLRAAMEANGQKRQNILLRAQYAKQLEEARTKAAADEAKYQRDKQDKKETAEIKYSRDKELIQERARNRSTGDSRRSYVDLQDNKGNYVKLPPAVWNVAAQDVYGELTRKNIIPKLTVVKKDPTSGTGVSVEVTSPSQIAAYVAQNADSIPDYIWEKLYARERGQGYKSEEGDDNAAAIEPATQPNTTITPSWKIPKTKNVFTPQVPGTNKPKFSHSPY